MVSSRAGGVHGLSGAGCDRTAGSAGAGTAPATACAPSREAPASIGRPSPSTWPRPSRWACPAARPHRPTTSSPPSCAGCGRRPWVGRPRSRSGSRRYQAQIAAWLADGLRLTKIHRRLREQGVGVPYSSLHRFAQAHCGFGAAERDRPRRRAAARRGRRSRLRAVGPVAGSRHRRAPARVRAPRHAGLQPLRLPVGRPPPGPADGPRGAGGGVDLLPGRGPPRSWSTISSPSSRAPIATRPTIDRVFLEYAQYRGFLVDPAVPAARHRETEGRAGHPVRPPGLLPRRGLPRSRRHAGAGGALVPRPGRHPRPRHHAPGPARRVRDRGAADAPAAGARALRSADLGPVHRPSRSPHPVPARPLLRPDPLHRRTRSTSAATRASSGSTSTAS